MTSASLKTTSCSSCIVFSPKQSLPNGASPSRKAYCTSKPRVKVNHSKLLPVGQCRKMLFWIGSSTMFIQKLEILASSVFIADSLWKEIHRVERCCFGLGLLQCLSKNLKFWPAQCSLLIVFGKRFIVLDPMITKRIILSTGLDINLLII